MPGAEAPFGSHSMLVQGLEDTIGLSATHPTWQRTRPNDPEDSHWGWTFASDGDPPFDNENGEHRLQLTSVGCLSCQDHV